MTANLNDSVFILVVGWQVVGKVQSLMKAKMRDFLQGVCGAVYVPLNPLIHLSRFGKDS
jgi:hypothetical protein